MITTTTIRQAVANNLENHLANALRKAHELNYETLYVDRDGEIWWSEEASADTHIIDREADEFAAIPSLIQVGTGSIRCNCDWCDGPNAVQTTDEIDFESEEFDYFRERIIEALGSISVGYFRDEVAEL